MRAPAKAQAYVVAAIVIYILIIAGLFGTAVYGAARLAELLS